MKRILIVDDKEENLYYLQALLVGNGFSVQQARHGAEALVKARQSPCDLIISDLLMPIMDGYTLLRHCKADPKLREIPFVVYTATYTEPEDEKLAYSLGADAFILKPAEPEDFLAGIRGLKGKAATPGAPAGDEKEILKHYSETLIRKLEEKAIQLEEANRALQQDIAERKQAQLQLKLLETSVAHLNDIIIITEAEPQDEPGPRILFVNDAFETITGYSRNDIIGRSPRLLQGPKTSRAELDRIRAAMSRWQPVRSELLNYRKNGEPFWIELDIVPVADASGWYTHWVSVERDITERKRLEAELVRREQLLNAFFSNAPVGMMVRDRGLRYLQVNETVARIYGQRAEEFLGKSTRDVIPKMASTVEPILQRVLECGEPILNQELSGETPAQPGLTRYWTASYFPIPDREGRIEAVGSIIIDISDRKQAEVERDRLFNLSLDMLSVADFEGRLLHVNPAWTECLGWSAEELTGVPMIEFILPEDHQATRDIRNYIYAGTAVRGFQNRYRCKDGSFRWLSWNVQPIPDLKRVFAVARDITEQRAAEEASRRREAEERRHAEERALLTRRLLESQAVASVGSWETDLRTMAVTWTEETYRIFQKDPALFTPTHAAFLELVHPEDRAKVDEAFAASLGKPGNFVLEHRILMPDWEIRTVEERWRVFTDDAGQPARALGTCQDITTRKQAQEQLREREDLLLSAQDIAGLGSWVMDMQSGRLVWSDATCRLFGITQAEFRESFEYFRDFILPEDGPAYDAVHAGVTPERPLLEVEYRIRRPDGSVRRMYERGKVEYDPAGKQTRRLGLVMDVTERHEARERLREQDEMLQIAGSLARLGGWSVDLPEMRLHWSDEVAEIHGMPKGSTPTFEQLLGFFTPESRDAFRAAFEACARDGVPYELELEKITPAGKQVWVHAIGRAERDASGKVTRVRGALQDITERKNMENQFLRTQRLESIGTLAGGIAHDLNNVLAPITMAADILEMDLKQPDNLEVVRMIKSSAKRAADLVRQVLSFSRGADGQRVLVDVESVVSDLNKLAKDTFPKNIAIESQVSQGLWRVKADPTQLHQVLLNLYVNARDAMPRGGSIRVELGNETFDEVYAHLSPHAKPGSYVVIAVTDDGEGMTPEVSARIFDPFFTTKEVGKGTGLGLSTALGIVRGYGGFINVYSEPGRGSTFKLYLPASADERADWTQPPEASSEQFPRGAGELILVVDDEESVRQAVKRTLERFGYKVQAVNNGAEAVSLYAQAPRSFAVVLTDMSMPIMDGPATIVALKTIDPAVVVVGSSGLDANDHVARAAGAGVKYFIPKPYVVEAMLKTLAAAVTESKGSRERAAS